MKNTSLVPVGWNPKQEADRVLERLVNVCLPKVKGAHDSELLLAGDKAYVVYMANDVQPGENPCWPFVYNALSIVDLPSGRVEKTVPFAASEMAYENETLPTGACFVPRIVRKDAATLRCFFASESPGKRESQTWYVDFDVERGEFARTIHRPVLETELGVFPMHPEPFFRQAAARGFAHPGADYGLYMIDSFKPFDGRTYCVLNTFPRGGNALATLNAERDRFTVLGSLFMPAERAWSETAFNRLPDETWLAISRQEGGDFNYGFSRSPDGKSWSPHEAWPLVPNGTNSKPTLDCFGGIYYLGWQEATRVGGAFRSVFNIEVSRDGEHWERKYRFESAHSFQYPTFREHRGSIYLTVTQGDNSDSLKERIMFGRLE